MRYKTPTGRRKKSLLDNIYGKEFVDELRKSSDEIRINLNENVKFKLTDYGKDIYYHRFDELNETIIRKGGKPLTPRMPEVDANGYTTMQLWCFIELYGNYIRMAMPNVIKPLEIIYEHQIEKRGNEQ